MDLITPDNLGGRPKKYTTELADLICQKISQGKSLKSICSEEGMPSMSSVFNWIHSEKGFLEKYDAATEERTIAMGEEIIDLSDDSLNLAQSVDPKAAGAVVAAAKLQVDTRKWVMSKMKPKKYGDKVDVTSGGEVIKGNTIVFSDMKNETDSKPSI